MRVELVILVKKTPENSERLEFLDCATPWNVRSGTDFLETRIPARSPEADSVLAQLESAGFEFYLREERHFGLREIRQAKILKTGPESQILSNHLPNQVEFDWTDVCQTCMRSPSQVGPLFMNHARLAEEQAIFGPRHELIVSEKVALRMIKDGITGCILREIEQAPNTSQGDSQYFQVIVTRQLPRAFSPPTRFISTDDFCKSCGQGGLFLDSALYYDVEEQEFQDVNHTHETFGQGAGISPELLVSSRFYNLLLSCGAHLEEPEPVVFV
ncbi:MAG: hypothetical protein ACI97A_004244 [Planctomycetota bacterium]|jgi:hypothetical protein